MHMETVAVAWRGQGKGGLERGSGMRRGRGFRYQGMWGPWMCKGSGIWGGECRAIELCCRIVPYEGCGSRLTGQGTCKHDVCAGVMHGRMDHGSGVCVSLACVRVSCIHGRMAHGSGVCVSMTCGGGSCMGAWLTGQRYARA